MIFVFIFRTKQFAGQARGARRWLPLSTFTAKPTVKFNVRHASDWFARWPSDMHGGCVHAPRNRSRHISSPERRPRLHSWAFVVSDSRFRTDCITLGRDFESAKREWPWNSPCSVQAFLSYLWSWLRELCLWRESRNQLSVEQLSGRGKGPSSSEDNSGSRLLKLTAVSVEVRRSRLGIKTVKNSGNRTKAGFW